MYKMFGDEEVRRSKKAHTTTIQSDLRGEGVGVKELSSEGRVMPQGSLLGVALSRGAGAPQQDGSLRKQRIQVRCQLSIKLFSASCHLINWVLSFHLC